jgi:hypothetical protein
MISAPASGGGPGRRPAAGVRSAGAERLAPFGFAFGKTTSPAQRGQKAAPGTRPFVRGHPPLDTHKHIFIREGAPI